MIYKIPFIKPSFPRAELIAEDYTEIVKANWFTNFGPKEQEFSQKSAAFISSKNDVYATTVSNATIGIDLAIRALMLGDNNKNQVIVPSFTFAAGPECIISNNLVPVLIDINQDDLQPSIAEAKKYIEVNESKIAGILLCNTFGVGNKNVEEWENLARKHRIPLVIDSAAGLGSMYTDEENIGARGDCEIFSLHATKPFCVGEGGLITSKSSELIEKLRSLENFGFDSNRDIKNIGTNGKLQEINCAIGLRQLHEYPMRLKARRDSLEIYKEKLTGAGYAFQDNDNLSTVPFVTAIAPSSQDAEGALKHLNEQGIEVKKYYSPLHEQPVIAQRSILASDFKVTNEIYSRIISLPMHDAMHDADIEYIVSKI